jgi:predicted translin family RNA/ssDNA-binding protein
MGPRRVAESFVGLYVRRVESRRLDICFTLFIKGSEPCVDMERADEIREVIKAIRDKTQYLRRTLGRTLAEQILTITDTVEKLLDEKTCSLDLLRARECGLFEAAVLSYSTDVYLTQYQRQLEKLEEVASIFKRDITGILQMVGEIRRRVDEVMDKAYRCYSK